MITLALFFEHVYDLLNVLPKAVFHLIGTSLYSGACFCVWPSSRELIVTVGIDLFTKTCRLCTLSPVSRRGNTNKLDFVYGLQLNAPLQDFPFGIRFKDYTFMFSYK